MSSEGDCRSPTPSPQLSAAYRTEAFAYQSFDLLQNQLCATDDPTTVYNTRCGSKTLCTRASGTEWNNLLQKVIQHKIIRYLQGQSMPNSLFSNQVILSGSAMLQCSLNRQWLGADTDIFCTEEAYDTVHGVLLAASYKVGAVVYFGYPPESDTGHDSSSDGEHEISRSTSESDTGHDSSSVGEHEISRSRRTSPVEFRDCLVQWTCKWSRAMSEAGDDGKTKSQHVDVVVALPGASDAFVLINQFDIHACKSSWNGVCAAWPEMGHTFAGCSALSSQVLALLIGFIKGWSEHRATVDEFHSMSAFLRSPLWKSAAGKALEAAKEYYSEHQWHQLAEDLALYTKLSGTRAFVHFSFFHGQLSRIVKYTRRGIRILHLPCWWHVWIGLEHVKGLPH